MSTRYKRPKKVTEESKTELNKKNENIEKPYIIRLRGKDGTFNYEGNENDTIESLKSLIETNTGISKNKLVLSTNRDETISSFHLSNKSGKLKDFKLCRGDVVYFSYDSNLKSKQEVEDEKQRLKKEALFIKYQKGDEPLTTDELLIVTGRKHWKFGEYEKYLEGFKYILDLPFNTCSSVYVDGLSGALFSNVLEEYAYTIQRCGYLIGITKKVDRPQRFQKTEDGKQEEVQPSKRELEATFEEVEVYAIYEPPQFGDEKTVQEYDDENEEKVDTICSLLGMKRVGYIFSHGRGETQEKHKIMPDEIVRAAKLQSKYGSSFVTIAATFNSSSGLILEAFQVSEQCVELAEKDLLSIDPKNDSILKSKKGITIVGTTLEKNEVDIEFFYTFNTPMKRLDGPFRAGMVPKNRKEEQSLNKLRTVLINRKNQGLNFVKRITDFHLLLYLTEFLDMKTDMPTLLEAVRTQNNSMAGGFEYLINSYAGIQ
eukprot:gene2472-3181_t